MVTAPSVRRIPSETQTLALRISALQDSISVLLDLMDPDSNLTTESTDLFILARQRIAPGNQTDRSSKTPVDNLKF